MTGRALELVQPNSHQAGVILSHHGLDLGQSGDYQGARDAFDKALEIALYNNDVKLEMRILVNSGDVAGHHNHWDERLETANLH